MSDENNTQELRSIKLIVPQPLTRLKTKDEKVISSVEKLLPSKKLTPNNKPAQNVSTHE